MKSQKASSEQKLNNLLGKSRQKQLKPDEAQKLQRGLEHEVKCFGKAINELNLQIHDLQKQEQELKPWIQAKLKAWGVIRWNIFFDFK